MTETIRSSASSIYPPLPELQRSAHIGGRDAYDRLVAEADADYEGYWARLARDFVTWKTPFQKVLDSRAAPHYTWFEDGTLNVSYNCLDRHVEAGRGAKTAIIFEADDGTVTRTTYAELLAQTCRMANALRALGVGKGDRVVIYLPMSVEGVVAMQACARIGAVHSSSSAACPRTRCTTASPTPARSSSSPPISRCAAARPSR